MNSRLPILLIALSGAGTAQPAPDLREAARLDQAGRCQESEVIYQAALSRGAPGPALLNNAGNHYLACGQPDKARDFLERLLKASPTHPNAALQLARLDMSAGNFASAADRLAKLSSARPGEFEVLFLLGQASARAGQIPRARESLEAALRLRPEDPAAMFECGLANAAAGDFPRAVFLLARAEARLPGRPAVALALARASEDAGYYGDAVTAYNRYLEQSPNDRGARRDRARALALTVSGREQGTRELAAYITSNPSDPLGHFYLAQIEWNQDPEPALGHLAKAVRLDPKLGAAHIARSWLLHRLGRDEEALSHAEAAERIEPANVRALDQLGAVLLSLGRSADAAAVLHKAAKLAPEDAGVALHLGRALVDQGREQEGQVWLDAYQKLRPARQRDARRESGMIELAVLDPAGRRAREIDRFRSMARSRPDDPLLQLHLAGLLLADGQSGAALAEYKTLLTLNADPGIWTQAGRALAAAGQLEAALPFLQRAEAKPELARVQLLIRARGLNATGRSGESARMLAEAATHSPGDAELQLTHAVAEGLSGRTEQAAAMLRRIEARWPEWDRPWIVHGLLLKESKRLAEAAAKFRTAAALGSREDAAACANLREWVSATCQKQQPR